MRAYRLQCSKQKQDKLMFTIRFEVWVIKFEIVIS